MAEQLTPLERRVYHFLLDFLSEQSYQPSIREIAKKFRIKSTKTVSDLLQSLAAKGYIERDRARSRGVRLIGFSAPGLTQPVPVYGKVHAGEPALLPEHRTGWLTVDRRFLASETTFSMKVKGDSMVGRAILDGDFVLVTPAKTANEGDIVVARLGDEATVKTIHYRDGRIVLRPANPAEREIEVGDDEDFALMGVVSGVFRPFAERNPIEKLES